MSKNRKKGDWLAVSALAVLGLLLASLGLYVGGYFLMPETTNRNFPILGFATVRTFDAAWKARIYQPMAKLESLVSGRRVLLAVPTRTDPPRPSVEQEESEKSPTPPASNT